MKYPSDIGDEELQDDTICEEIELVALTDSEFELKISELEEESCADIFDRRYFTLTQCL
jgi:hypothetical protein